MKNSLLFVIAVFLFCTISISELSAQWVKANDLGNGTYKTLRDNQATLLAGSYGAGIYRSTDHGASWTAASNGLVGYGSLETTALAFSGTVWYVGTHWGGVFRSFDDGLNWNALNSGLVNKNIASLACHGASVFAGTIGGGVFFKGDNDTSWIQVNTGLLYFSVLSLLVSGTDIFVGLETAGVYRSTDNGANWTSANNGLTNGKIYALTTFSSGGSTELLAGTAGGVFRSSDNGASWSEFNTGLSHLTIFTICTSGANIFAGTAAGGVYLYPAGGSSWYQVNGGLPQFPGAGSLEVSGPYLIAGIGNTGVWRRPLADMITAVEDNQNTLPNDYSLSQNYPNPFNPSTTITFSIPNEEFVSLKVFNSLGEEVAELLNEEKPAGNYSVSFDASSATGGLTSGVYFYKIKAGNFVETKKMILLR